MGREDLNRASLSLVLDPSYRRLLALSKGGKNFTGCLANSRIWAQCLSNMGHNSPACRSDVKAQQDAGAGC